MTAHGGSVVGPGCPTVMINKVPAIRVGPDMHLCPMVTPGTPPIPHVGMNNAGPGVATVMIGKMPASTVGDSFLCAGPPAPVTTGAFDVLIGTAGPGGAGAGGGGAGGSAGASTRAARATTPKKVKGLSADGIPVSCIDAGENPEVDAACHRLDTRIIGGRTNQEEDDDEGLSHGRITGASWASDRCWFGEEVELTLRTRDMKDGTKLTVKLFEWDATSPDDFIIELDVSSTGEETTVKWKAEIDVEAVSEADEGLELEVYPVVEIVEAEVARVLRREILHVDVVGGQDGW
jgi:uncharacterized Zn-binding protein involved in type VI secretion